MAKPKTYGGKQIAKQLVGSTITAAIEENKFFGFEAQKDGKTFRVWVDDGSEGNGPGHLKIEPK